MLFLHLVEHFRAVPGQRGHHGSPRKITVGCYQWRCAARRIVVTRGAFLGDEDIRAGAGVATAFQHSAGPYIAGDGTHLTRLKLLRAQAHIVAMIPHVRCDIGQGFVTQTR